MHEDRLHPRDIYLTPFNVTELNDLNAPLAHEILHAEECFYGYHLDLIIQYYVPIDIFKMETKRFKQ